jgi:eukaryotic-like serine/threonine-protein kinase
MRPIEPDQPSAHGTEESLSPSGDALDAGLAVAFEPDGTRSHHPTPDLEPGTIIAGKYKLSERIGEGGMGSVWVANQSEPVKRKVAVKLIKPGMDTKQVLARFEAERQALAVMDHPNIAKVLDGGIYDGRPFFVMELVKGVPITEYCDAHKLTLRERLELFVPVCQAIQHAHHKGIIHRDIKPSNVLIALYDDRPVPKVIDFGVAKATGGTLTEHTIETRFGGVVGTPQYMSPEQATLNNLDVDTRSDVYSLGVLLYELLAGSPPFSRKELEKEGLLEMLRVVREEEPPRPSTKLSTADALPTLSVNRGTEPKKLTGLLRNELDWIVMKALEKDRSRRYETANGFAADIHRYLSGDPVGAHPPGTMYRLRKFVRRNKPQVIGASLVLLALLTGIAGTTFGLVRAESARRDAVASAEREADERKKAEAAKAEAQAKEAEANAVVKFFEGKVLAAGRPKGLDGGLGHDVSLRDAVRASLPALGTSFKDQPLVEARLRYTLAVTFYYLGDHAQAANQYERARALYTLHRGPDDRHTLASMFNMATCYEALGRHAEALKLREEVLAARDRALSPDHPDTISDMLGLANSYATLNRHTEALKLREEALAGWRRVRGPDHPDTLLSMGILALSYESLNRPAEALKLREETLAAQKRVLGPDHPETLRSMMNLARSYAALDRQNEALTLREEALAGYKRLLPPDHPLTLLSMHNLAYSYAALNRHGEALKLREETLAARRRVLPPDHPDTLRSMMSVAHSYAALNRHNEARTLYRAATEQLEKQNPADAGSLYNAACYRAMTASLQAKAKDPDAARLAREDADKAMAWLTKAVAAGYTNAAHMRKDSDLDFLRDREDFKKLLAELEAKVER